MSVSQGTASPSILALDLSLTRTGWCLDGEVGTIVPEKLRGPERLNFIEYEIVRKVLDVDLAVLEGYSFGSRGRATYGIAELGGVVRLMLWRFQVPYVEVPPATLKKWATARGNATKLMMLYAAFESGLETRDHNEADAFLLYEMARLHYAYAADQPSAVAWPTLAVMA